MARKLKSRSSSRSRGKKGGLACSKRRRSTCVKSKGCVFVYKKGCRNLLGKYEGYEIARDYKGGFKPKSPLRRSPKTARRKGVNCSKKRKSSCSPSSGCKWVVNRGCKSQSGKYKGSVSRKSPRRRRKSPILPMYSYSM